MTHRDYLETADLVEMEVKIDFYTYTVFDLKMSFCCYILSYLQNFQNLLREIHRQDSVPRRYEHRHLGIPAIPAAAALMAALAARARKRVVQVIHLTVFVIRVPHSNLAPRIKSVNW